MGMSHYMYFLSTFAKFSSDVVIEHMLNIHAGTMLDSKVS